MLPKVLLQSLYLKLIVINFDFKDHFGWQGNAEEECTIEREREDRESVGRIRRDTERETTELSWLRANVILVLQHDKSGQ